MIVDMTIWSLPVVVYLLWLCHPVRTVDFPFRNPSLPINQRLDDLLSRLTVAELILQVSKGGAGPQHGPAPGIERLGIDPFQWRTNPGDGEGTSFPLPINQAATFDPDLVYRIAFATGLEMRAKWNANKRLGIYNDGLGIHVYAPVANLMRHPLWGRNQETYGEDPHLSGQLVEAYVRGVGGWKQINPQHHEDKDNPLSAHTILVTADCKHFAAHTGPEDFPVSRLSFEAKVPMHDMWLTYLPAFRSCLQAGAVSVMCAYSGINGTPDCVNHWLLTDVLRNQWNFRGFVVTDCGALQFAIFKHHAFRSNEEAALAAINAGVNLENSVSNVLNVFSVLPQLVHDGNVSRDVLVEMARPLFLARFLQGEFNPAKMDPYRFLSPEMFVQCARHRKLALMATASSIVLVHHRPGVLPLQPIHGANHKPPLRRVAVLGPFATKVDELYGGYRNIRVPEFEVSVQKGMEQISEVVDADDICFNGAVCSSINTTAMTSILHRANLSLIILTVGTGNRVEAEGQDRENISLPGKQSELLQKTLELVDSIGALENLSMIPIVLLVFSTGPVDIQIATLHPRVVAIYWCGFPGAQIGAALARIMLGNSGDPYGPQAPLSSSIDDDQELGSWGTSSQVDNFWWFPAARLPFTWYRSIDHLPDMTFYRMTNQTYRYLPSQCHRASDDCKLPVLFPFGYGLTYNLDKWGANGFVYSNLVLPSSPILIGQPFAVYTTVTNRGPLASDEVVQCYIAWMKPNGKRKTQKDDVQSPNIQLAGFRRIGLRVGEYRQIKFVVPSATLSVWSERSNGTIPGEGRLRVTVGGQQPNQETSVGSNVITGYVEIVDII